MLYKYKDGSGQTVYSDQPPSASETSSPIAVIRNGVVVDTVSAKKDDPYAKAKGYISDAKKHIPKALVYVEYIEYLRKNNPGRYIAFVQELAKNDPKSYANLQKAGLFQPLKAHQRLSNLIDSSVAVGGDLFAGKSGFSGITTLAEKTLVGYMKKDGFIPPDVLGSKATTLPKTVPQYSNTRLGQWSKMQDAQIAKLSKETQRALAGKPVLAAGATAATRVGGPVLDVMIRALDPQVFSGFSAIFGTANYIKESGEKGIHFTDEERVFLRGHFARSDWEAIRNLTREAALRK